VVPSGFQITHFGFEPLGRMPRTGKKNGSSLTYFECRKMLSPLTFLGRCPYDGGVMSIWSTQHHRSFWSALTAGGEGLSGRFRPLRTAPERSGGLYHCRDCPGA